MKSVVSLFDAHNHLHDAWLAPHRDQVVEDLVKSGVKGCIVNGTSEADWPNVTELCAGYINGPVSLIPSFGLHPWDVGNRTPDWQRQLTLRLNETPHAGMGEIGLDRWMLDRARPDDPRLAGLRRASLDEQLDVFRWQLALAAERNLPTSIHCLDAFGPLYDALSSATVPARGFLLHAYNGSSEMAHAFAKFGAYFSFNGAFLDPRKERVRDVYAKIPANRLLVETDAPAMLLPLVAEEMQHPNVLPPTFTLPPSPDGDPINHPANLARTYAALANLRHTDVAPLAAQIEQNFRALFIDRRSE